MKIANYNEQVLLAWEEYESDTGENATNPDDFLTWAMSNNKLPAPIEDVRKLMRRRVATALRQKQRVDANGVVYRAKQCFINWEKGQQIPLWFDTDTGGTPNLRRKAVGHF